MVRNKLRSPSFGIQVVIGMAAGLALGMAACAMGPGAVPMAEGLHMVGQLVMYANNKHLNI